jgi:predicted metalloprotease with PDZ domain
MTRRRRSRPTPRAGLAGLCCAVLLTVASPAQGRAPAAPVEYRVSIPVPTRQWIEVDLFVPPGRRERTLALPAWTPGSYLVRDFARHVWDVEATAPDGAPLPVRRVDKQTWSVSGTRRGAKVRYRVFADELSVRTSHVDDLHATLNGASVFLYLVGDEDRPHLVRIDAPAGWETHTVLPRDGDGRFAATSYEHLVDAPFELGSPKVHHFTVNGTRIEWVLTRLGPAALDEQRATADVQRVVAAFARMLGGLPFARYVFFVTLADRGGGGLEHADCTMLQVARDQFASEKGYLSAARLVAHEFFHAWNVKRIRDRALVHLDWRGETYSRLLWFHEGVTSTMEEVSLLRAGLLSRAAYLDALAEALTRYRRLPGRNREPLAQVSADAWVKQYKPAANHSVDTVSYYDKGALVGVALDLELRRRSLARGGEGSLPGLFRRLLGRPRLAEGITAADLVAAASAEAGEDMAWFFRDYVEGTRELELEPLLAAFGVRSRWHAPWEETKGDAVAAARRRPWAGWELDGATVKALRPQGPAAAAGMMIGDRLLGLAGRAVGDDPAPRLAELAVGETAELVLSRRGRVLTLRLHVAENPDRNLALELVPDAELDATTRRLRDTWLETYDVGPAAPAAASATPGCVDSPTRCPSGS